MLYKDTQFNFVYDFKFPNGFVDYLYGRNYISNYFLQQTEEELKVNEQYMSSLPHEPSNFNKFEQGMFLEEYLERNRNWKKVLLTEIDDDHMESLKDNDKKEFFIACLDSTPYSDLFSWYSGDNVKLKDFFSPRFLKFFKKYDSFKILFMDIREGSYWMNPKLSKKVTEFLDELNIKSNNKVIISNCDNKILKFKTSDKRINYYNNNYYICKSGQFISECESENNKIVHKDYTYSIQEKINYEPKEKWFLNYNRNSARFHRPYLVNQLYKKNILDKGIVSLIQTNEFDEMVKRNHSEHRLKIDSEEVESWKENLSEWYPLVIDNGNEHEVAWYHNFLSRKDEYEKTWFSLVSETSADDEFLFITEKTMKPIMNLHPFIINGNPNSLKLLKSLGFKTFSKFWDESYDSEIDFKKRIDKILKIVDYLCNKTQDEMAELIKSMSDILHYNKKHLQTINRKKVFEKTLLENLEDNTNML